MSTMVSGRVPDEVAVQAGDLLKQMGASTTQLINSAYTYLLKTGSLPGDALTRAEGKRFHTTSRTLSAEQAEEIRSLISSCTLSPIAAMQASSIDDPASDDDVLADALWSKYEALA